MTDWNDVVGALPQNLKCDLAAQEQVSLGLDSDSDGDLAGSDCYDPDLGVNTAELLEEFDDDLEDYARSHDAGWFYDDSSQGDEELG